MFAALHVIVFTLYFRYWKYVFFERSERKDVTMEMPELFPDESRLPQARVPAPRSRAASGAAAAVEVEVEVEAEAPVACARVDASTVAYSIRAPTSDQRLPCYQCGRIFRVLGPTGFLGVHPVCDGCLLAGDAQLGMVLTILSVCRHYGSTFPTGPEEERLYRRELMAFARVYERFAGRYGPARPWNGFLPEPLPGRGRGNGSGSG